MRVDPEKKRRARELRQTATPAEAIVWKRLRNRAFANFKFRRQVNLGQYYLDFYCAECGLALEIDGDTHIGRERPDANRQRWIEQNGIKVLRIWNSDVYSKIDDVMKYIWSECQQRRETRFRMQRANPSPRVRPINRTHVGPLPGGARGTNRASSPRQPDATPIRILFQDSDLLAVDKPPGVPVHQAPGPGTSVMRILREQHGLENLTPVHRLDKDASGVLLFAKSKEVASEVTKGWSDAEKTYLALCGGIPKRSSGSVDAPILENQTGKPERLNNAVKWFTKNNPGIELPPLPPPKTSAVHPAGRASITDYRIREKLKTSAGSFSFLEVRPRQGRMHQIRVHMAHIGCPLLMDKLYGKTIALPGGFTLSRMPLHAAELKIQFRGEKAFRAELPDDIAAALNVLRKQSSG